MAALRRASLRLSMPRNRPLAYPKKRWAEFIRSGFRKSVESIDNNLFIVLPWGVRLEVE